MSSQNVTRKRVCHIGACALAGVMMGCQPQPVGGGRDAHGCLPAAGYQWCPAQQECVRSWEIEQADAERNGPDNGRTFEQICLMPPSH